MTESLKTFGAAEQATEAIAVRFTEADVYKAGLFENDLITILNCEISAFSTEFCDLNLVKDVYKPSNSSNSSDSDSNRFIGEICTTIATKNI